MLSDYRSQTIAGVWGGIVFFCIGFLISSLPQSLYRYFGYLIMLGGYLLFVCGCWMYAKGKGYSWFLGLLGFFGPLGLLVLYCLNDRSKRILARKAKEA